jgi:hypothetical protein
MALSHDRRADTPLHWIVPWNFMRLSMRSIMSRLVLVLGGMAGLFTSGAAFVPSGFSSHLAATPAPTIQPSQAPLKDWTAPLQISPDGMFAWFPDVAADRTGRVHITWSSTINGFDSVMYTSSADAVNWDPINDIEGLKEEAGSEATRPGLLVDQNGFLDLTFRGTSVFFSQAFGGTALSAQSWRSPAQISGKQVAYFSRLALDSKGWLHAVYTENVPDSNCPICFHLFYTHSLDSGTTWTNPIDISKQVLGVVKPQILVGPQDTLYVTWEAGIGGGYGQLSETYPTKILFAVSTDGGDHWSTPFQVSDASAQGKNVSLGLDQNGLLTFVWLDPGTDLIDYRQLDPGANHWSTIETIPGIWGEWSVYTSRLDSSEMAPDSSGNLHLVLIGRTAIDQTGLNVLHLAWDGSKWSAPEMIATYSGDMPEWPRIAVANGNQLNLVWFVRDKAHVWGGTDASPAMYTVWYAHGNTGSPAVPAASYPAPTIKTQQPASPTPGLQSTPTPEPTQAKIPAESTSPITPPNLENNLLILFGEGLVPSIGLILIVLVVKKIRGR